ncbi:hypothetical protein E2C01_086080 [Portunus trituberculatus]|uniref:Uncharacterized protein n=1 Tax=Portunus trituberculatus TaxID=210409 RepID=A0A5B7JCH0_PORTR|nr:hypothetical protein [Portunus trituberculatus]
MLVRECYSRVNPFCTMTRFHIHSAYYLMILYSFRNLWGIKIVKILPINLLTFIDPS